MLEPTAIIINAAGEGNGRLVLSELEDQRGSRLHHMGQGVTKGRRDGVTREIIPATGYDKLSGNTNTRIPTNDEKDLLSVNPMQK